jgi:pyruvate/2-oxoglutarate/acetoin dehydrogenase E1 component
VRLDPRPVLFLEQKLLYAKRLHPEPPPGLTFVAEATETDALYPTGVWRPADVAGDVTVVTYGAMTEIVEAAIAATFVEDEIVVEYVVPAQLAPLRPAPIVESVRRTGRLVVVEEGTGPWGFGAELVAAVIEALPGRPLRCARVAAHPLPIPNARPAEDVVLPDAARVASAIRQVMR